MTRLEAQMTDKAVPLDVMKRVAARCMKSRIPPPERWAHYKRPQERKAGAGSGHIELRPQRSCGDIQGLLCILQLSRRNLTRPVVMSGCLRQSGQVGCACVLDCDNVDARDCASPCCA